MHCHMQLRSPFDSMFFPTVDTDTFVYTRDTSWFPFLASQLPSLHVRKYRRGRMRRVRSTSIKIHEKYENHDSLSLFSCYSSSSTFIRTFEPVQSHRVLLRYCARLLELWDSYITWEFVWIIENRINVYVKVSVASEERCEDCVSRTRIAVRHEDLVVRDKSVRRAREIFRIVVLWKNASIINPLRINVMLIYIMQFWFQCYGCEEEFF